MPVSTCLMTPRSHDLISHAGSMMRPPFTATTKDAPATSAANTAYDSMFAPEQGAHSNDDDEKTKVGRQDPQSGPEAPSVQVKVWAAHSGEVYARLRLQHAGGSSELAPRQVARVQANMLLANSRER